MEPLENFIYISLDIFRQMEHNRLTELDAWMYFLGSDHPGDILRIIRQYPFFQALYQDIIKFRYQPKELITMFSEALRIMDQNAVEYMVDELKAEMSRLSLELARMNSELSEMDSKLSEKNSELSKKDSELSKKDSELSKKDMELAKKDMALKEQNDELERLRTLLKQNTKQNPFLML